MPPLAMIALYAPRASYSLPARSPGVRRAQRGGGAHTHGAGALEVEPAAKPLQLRWCADHP